MEGAILIVDDEEEILKSLSTYLTLEGYDVQTCSDPVTALTMAKNAHYPVVLCDIMMPNMSGIELLKEIHNIRPMCNVIMMTAYGSMDKVVECLGSGAVDYIVKPFKSLDLVGARIGEAVSRISRWREAIALQ